MAKFTPMKLNLNELNSGERYNNGDVESAESINSPIEGTAYVQNVSETAEKKANIVVRNVSTTTGLPTDKATVTAVTSYNGTDRTNLDFTFKIPQGKQGRSITPRGNWLSGATYSFNSDVADSVYYNGTQYIAKQTHVASVSNMPPNSSYWQVLASVGKGLIWRGNWTTGVSYTNNETIQDLVSYNGRHIFAYCHISEVVAIHPQIRATFS